MYMAIDAVRSGRAQAIVSAGNTGALMAISKMVLKTMQKIHRPAIVSIMPHLNGRYVMLDLGANTECDAVNLAEFAIMGNVVAKHALDLKQPKVALLNIGAEAMKGKEEIRQAAGCFTTLSLTSILPVISNRTKFQRRCRRHCCGRFYRKCRFENHRRNRTFGRTDD